MSPDQEESASQRSRARWHRFATVATFALAIGITAAVTRTTVTPARQMAQRSPAEQQPVIVSPVHQELRDLRIGTCTLAASEQTLLVPAASEAPRAVFTRVGLTGGQPITSGSVVAEISGRPLIALDLPFPLYRDIAPCDTGPDVAAVQEALGRLDRYDKTPTGAFDRTTQAAVDQLYRDLGAPPARTGADLDDVARSAEQAEAELRAAAEAGELVSSSAFQAAVDARRAAQSRIGTRLPMAEVIVAPTSMATHHVRARVGAPADAEAPIADLRGPHATATCTFTTSGAAGLDVDQPATLQTSSGDHPGTIGAPSTGDGTVTVGFAPTEGPLPAGLAGQSASIEVVVASTDGEVLAVPAGAFREHPSGGSALAVSSRDGTTRTIEVDVGVIADGLVEVTSGDLDLEDRLVIAVEPVP